MFAVLNRKTQRSEQNDFEAKGTVLSFGTTLKHCQQASFGPTYDSISVLVLTPPSCWVFYNFWFYENFTPFCSFPSHSFRASKKVWCDSASLKFSAGFFYFNADFWGYNYFFETDIELVADSGLVKAESPLISGAVIPISCLMFLIRFKIFNL